MGCARLILLFFIMFSSSALARVTLSAEANVPRNLSSGNISLTIRINNIEDLKQGSEQYASRLTIIIDALDNDAIPIENISSADEISQSDYIFKIVQQEEVQQVQDNNQVNENATVYLRLEENGANANIDGVFEDNNNSITATIEYDDDVENEVRRLDNVTLERSNSVANEAPTNVRIIGSHLSLTARWDTKESITYSDGNTAAPGGIAMYVVEKDIGSVVVGGLVFDAEADSDTQAASCTIDTNAEEGTACVSCDVENAYIDRSNLPGTVKASTVGSSSTQITVDDLEEKNESDETITYLAFLAFEPDGLQFSTCHTGQARRNLTWSELLDEDIEAKKKNPRCFIATAAYGSSLDPKVDDFRWFRDEYLLRHASGRWFITNYYRYSPPAADYIARRPWLRAIVRCALWLPATVVGYLRTAAN